MLIPFDEVDIHMTHLENMIQMAETILFDKFLICGDGVFIDPRTVRNLEGMPVVKPIAENPWFFWYACPFCQSIHIESKRLLNHDRRVISANCPYRYQIRQEFVIDMPADPLAYQEVADQILHDEWTTMQEFLGSLKSHKEDW